MADIVLTVDRVTKVYHLYKRPLDRLLESLWPGRTPRHKDLYALNDVSFQVRRGEIIGIIGVNGSGKSTILKIITGVLSQTSGTVTVEGKISALLELGAGFNPEYTGLENIYLSGTMIGYSREEMTAKLPQIIDFADIGDYIGQPVKTYSSGMFARLAFAVSINVDPDILIIDEALSVGDYFFQAKCFKKFEEFREKGKTILFVSHDIGSILKYCDRAVLLNKGHLVHQGDVKETINLYKQCLTGRNEAQPAAEASSDPAAAVGSPGKASMHLNPYAVNYGDRQAEIIDFALINQDGQVSSFVQKNEFFTVELIVRFHRDIWQPIFAMTIRDLKGMDLYGTNTRIESTDTGQARAGDVYRVRFRQTMYLNNGNYLLSIGCTSYKDQDIVVHNRLYDVCSIDVISDKTTVGFVDFGSTVSVSVGRKDSV